MTKFYSDMTTATLYFAEDAVDVDSGSTDTSSQMANRDPDTTRASSMTSCTFAGAGFVISPTRGPGRNAHALWGASFTAFAEKLSYNSCGSTSTLLFCVILKTDKLQSASG